MVFTLSSSVMFSKRYSTLYGGGSGVVRVTSAMMRCRRSMSLINRPEHSSSQAREKNANTHLDTETSRVGRHFDTWSKKKNKRGRKKNLCVSVAECVSLPCLWVCEFIGVWSQWLLVFFCDCKTDRAAGAWNSAQSALITSTHTAGWKHTNFPAQTPRRFTETGEYTFLFIMRAWISLLPS